MCFFRQDYPSQRMREGILSLPGVLLPILRIDFSISYSIISGNRSIIDGTTGVVRGISLALVMFQRRLRARISLFTIRVIARGTWGQRRSFRESKQKDPTDLYYFAILKISLFIAALSSFFLKKDSFTYLVILQRVFFILLVAILF